MAAPHGHSQYKPYKCISGCYKIIIVVEVKLNPMHQLVLVVLWSPEVIIKFKCNSVQATILKLTQSNLTFTSKKNCNTLF